MTASSHCEMIHSFGPENSLRLMAVERSLLRCELWRRGTSFNLKKYILNIMKY